MSNIGHLNVLSLAEIYRTAQENWIRFSELPLDNPQIMGKLKRAGMLHQQKGPQGISQWKITGDGIRTLERRGIA